MLPITLLERFSCLTFVSRVEVRNMIVDSNNLTCISCEMYNVQQTKHGEERDHKTVNFKDLCVVTVYTCLKIYLYKKH